MLTNMYDPSRPDFAAKAIHEDCPAENKAAALTYLRHVLEGRTFGPPIATKTYTVEELTEMGFVSVDLPARTSGVLR